MNTITKRVETHTAHIVRGATSTRCKYNVHGHQYFWDITLEGKIKDNGMVKDFIELRPIRTFIDKFDHAMVLWDDEEESFKNFFLTNFKRIIIMNKNTTAENMARLIFKYTTDYYKNEDINVHSITVWETPTSYATTTECDDGDVLIYEHTCED